MIRTLILLSFVLAGTLARAEDSREAPVAAPKAEKEMPPVAAPANGEQTADSEKKSIFESQTKEDVEKMNHIDKSLYEVSGQVHPDEE